MDQSTKMTNFFEPIITAAGIIASLIASLLPIVSQTTIADFFLDKRLVTLGSVAAFIFSLAAIWIGTFFKYVTIEIPPSFLRKAQNPDGSYKYVPPWFVLSTQFIVILWLTLALFLLHLFLSLGSRGDGKLATIQVVIYILFFVVISSLFSILFSRTKDQYNYKEELRFFPKKVQSLLENNGQISQGVEIQRNEVIPFLVAQKLGLFSFGMVRYLKIKIPGRKEKVKHVIVRDDANELIRELSKEEIGIIEQGTMTKYQNVEKNTGK